MVKGAANDDVYSLINQLIRQTDGRNCYINIARCIRE